MAEWRPGSEQHKEIFCKSFMDTHDPYDPAKIDWPELDDGSLGRLQGLPIWEEAVNTERATALRVQALGETEPDPVMREAIALQGYEELRHYQLLSLLTRHYGIPVEMRQDPEKPKDPNWSFWCVGYAECFDSFFAFGLFKLAASSGFFPMSLVRIFEPVMQEEARHILFFANWLTYRKLRSPVWARPAYAFKSSLAVYLQVASRVKLALNLGGEEVDDNFTMTGHQSLGEITPRAFVETCLGENEKRLAPYDARLIRPRLAPSVARCLLPFLSHKETPP